MSDSFGYPGLRWLRLPAGVAGGYLDILSFMITENSLRATGGVHMNAASIILLVLISIWAVFSAVYSHKHSGSCGGCSGCDACKRNVAGAGLGGEDLSGENLSGKGTQAEDLIVKDPTIKDLNVKGAKEGKLNLCESELLAVKSSNKENTYTCSGSCGTCPYHSR